MYLDKAKDLADFLKKYPVIAMILNQLTPQERRMIIKWLDDIFKERYDQKTIKKIERILEENNPTEVKKMITNLERVIKREQEQTYRKGRADLLWHLIKKKFPELDNRFYDKIKKLDSKQIEDLSLALLDMKETKELEQYL